MKYQDINSGFQKKYLFQIGTGRGYCAEMIHLLKVIQMCLFNRIQLCLGQVHKPSGYAVVKGWEDYFAPAFPVESGIFLDQLNRPHFPLGRLGYLKYAARACLNAANGDHYYMFDHISWEFPEKAISEELGIKGGYWVALRELICSIYRYRDDVLERIEGYRNGLSMANDQPYLGVHVRRGDKIEESPYAEIESYAGIICNIEPHGMPIYLATDDSSILNELRGVLGNNFDIVSMASPMMKGYDQRRFNNNTVTNRWESTVFFMFELDMLIRSTIFIGASPSNVFYWTRYNRANENLIDVAECATGGKTL